MTALVLDASVTLSWYFVDERSSLGDAVLAVLEKGRAVAPGLWWLEVRNALIVSERRGRIDAAMTAEILANLARLDVDLDVSAESDLLLGLARAHRLTAYDAAYLELARRSVLPLATLDRALARAAKAEAIPLFGDV